MPTRCRFFHNLTPSIFAKINSTNLILGVDEFLRNSQGIRWSKMWNLKLYFESSGGQPVCPGPKPRAWVIQGSQALQALTLGFAPGAWGLGPGSESWALALGPGTWACSGSNLGVIKVFRMPSLEGQSMLATQSAQNSPQKFKQKP